MLRQAFRRFKRLPHRLIAGIQINIGMIIVTTRINEVGDWIEANCADTTYAALGSKLFIDLGEEDRLIWQLKWHGCFIQNPANVWHDNTELNRLIITLMEAQTYHDEAMREVRAVISRVRSIGGKSGIDQAIRLLRSPR